MNVLIFLKNVVFIFFKPFFSFYTCVSNYFTAPQVFINLQYCCEVVNRQVKPVVITHIESNNELFKADFGNGYELAGKRKLHVKQAIFANSSHVFRAGIASKIPVKCKAKRVNWMDGNSFYIVLT